MGRAPATPAADNAINTFTPMPFASGDSAAAPAVPVAATAAEPARPRAVIVFATVLREQRYDLPASRRARSTSLSVSSHNLRKSLIDLSPLWTILLSY